MKCSECVEAGTPSKVYVGASTTTCMSGESFYDEDGKYHKHNPNRMTTGYRCSNGHRWSENQWARCLQTDCGWKPHWAQKEE